MKKMILILVAMVFISKVTLAETSQERQKLPPFLKGIPWQGKQMKHGFIRWSDKKPITLLLNADVISP